MVYIYCLIILSDNISDYCTAEQVIYSPNTDNVNGQWLDSVWLAV